ncbi:MAG TPA: hypothetical protein VKR31_17225 [Rhizomicrobium sp.]|nr:hypothetical protein [Rhizomicrobium sp.]
MSEQDLFAIARSVTANEVAWFGQIVTINFAMIVGIYYFLNRAQIALRLFAYGVYLVGMFLYLGELLIESGVKLAVLESLKAIPHPSRIVQVYLDVYGSWLGILTAVLFNGAFWLMAIGVFYLLFFWKEKRPG